MSTAILRLHYKAMQRRVTSVAMPKIPWKFIYILVGLFSFVLLVSYIFVVNQLTQGAYTIKSYHKELSGLLEENTHLQASFAENSFLGIAQENAQKLNFEKITSVKYVQILETSLAQAK
jgi:hypothetical protein